MSTATLKRELALLRSSLAALTPTQSATLDDPIAWAERIAELTLDPWQRDVLLSAAPRLLLNATRQSGKSTVAALKAARTVLEGGLAVVVSPSLRQSGFLFRKLARHLVASEAAFRRETMGGAVDGRGPAVATPRRGRTDRTLGRRGSRGRGDAAHGRRRSPRAFRIKPHRRRLQAQCPRDRLKRSFGKGRCKELARYSRVRFTAPVVYKGVAPCCRRRPAG